MDERHDIEGTAATNGSNGRHEAESVTPVISGSEARAIEPARQVALPVPVVAAAGGAIVGAMAYALLRVLRRPLRRRSGVRIGKGRGRRGFEVSSSRSFLVDVHMLKR